MLKFHNTLTRKKEVFRPIEKGKVRMYTCGPTVYNFAHIGNFRAYVFEDLLRRYLKYKGYAVVQVMNLTDVDDKTIRDSQKEGVSLKEFTEKYAKAFFEDIKTLNIEPAEVYPKATEHINEMIQLIQVLLDKGIAYKTEDGVYYSISKFKNYGQLAHINVEKLLAGASGRVKADEYEKEQAADFALWKSWDSADGNVFWESPFGKGRPGWHIECSAMSMKHLTNAFEAGRFNAEKFETMDIHTGGVDNIFPHHQDEIAQSEGCTGKKFSNYWLHCEHLLVEGRKMSKSLGNFYTLRDLLAKNYDSKAIRYVLLSTHYRQQLNFTFESLEAAKNSVSRMIELKQKLEDYKPEKGVKHNKIVSELIKKSKAGFEKSMDNDLGISEALAFVFEFLKEANKLIAEKSISRKNAGDCIKFLEKVDSVLGIMQIEKINIPKDVLELVSKREEARKNKDWKLSDELREKIRQKGFYVDDTSEGAKIRKLD